MVNYTTEYKLCNGFETLKFNSEKEACEFLGVRESTVSKCFKSGCKCKGYAIERLGITSHGESRTKLYKIWISMHERCERKDHPNYKNYGGRGIYVCDDWKEYLKFKEWALSHGYENGLSLDRIDNDSPYCPENCRFVTIKQQANNRRTNKFFELNGVAHTLAEWSDITGIKYQTIFNRIKIGWSFEDAINKPVNKRQNKAVSRNEQRNRRNIFPRVDGKWQSICFSDLTAEEREKVCEGRDAEWFKSLAYHLADCIKEIGEQFDITGGEQE